MPTRPSHPGARAMILTTTPAIEGKRITRYLGIVTG
ncbi:MAG: heavy metal-binding domain-containing protein, partial [Phycisphaeraceae bacterium]|nr:heavy metal-binding domain-containing protein [Phycisphaeraceae bacterium]MCC7407989.1 heavy metal-binding domain-containing protein [Phycisphaeraceae bacterium]